MNLRLVGQSCVWLAGLLVSSCWSSPKHAAHAPGHCTMAVLTSLLPLLPLLPSLASLFSFPLSVSFYFPFSFVKTLVTLVSGLAAAVQVQPLAQARAVQQPEEKPSIGGSLEVILWRDMKGQRWEVAEKRKNQKRRSQKKKSQLKDYSAQVHKKVDMLRIALFV